MDLIIGSHVSFNKDTQMIGSIEEALSYKANTFMFYTGAPQNTNRCNIDEQLLEKAKVLLKENNIDINNVVVHAPYIINLANINNFDFNVNFLKQEIKRVDVGLGVENGINNIINALNQVLDDNHSVTICLETMAGKGTELGRTFEELKQIIDGVKHQDKVAVCMDTCHIHDAGYNLNDFNQVLEQFNKIIGLDKLKVLHINDSKNIIGSHKDRHENIGYGNIGFDNLIKVIYHEKLKGIPKILETPYIEKKAPYFYEIDMIRNKKFNDNLINDVINYNND